MEHEMILFSADMRVVHARLAKKFNASLVEQEQHRIRNAEDTVRGREEAPEVESEMAQ